jgi:hypothetical protein
LQQLRRILIDVAPQITITKAPKPNKNIPGFPCAVLCPEIRYLYLDFRIWRAASTSAP